MIFISKYKNKLSKMRYTLRSSNNSNLQGPLQFKRDKPVIEEYEEDNVYYPKLQTINEVDEDEKTPNNFYKVAFIVLMLQVLSVVFIAYYVTNNPFKIYIEYIYSEYIYYYFCLLRVSYMFIRTQSYLGRIYMSLITPVYQAHNYICQNILHTF
jgi:hypothetical protein